MELKDLVTIGLSSAALIVALSSQLWTSRQKALVNRRSIRASLTDTIASLSAASLAMAKLNAEHRTTDDRIVGLRRHYNSQRRYLASHAEFLADQIPEFVTDIDCTFLAQAFDAIGDYEKAGRYWARSVELSPVAAIRAQNLRGAARFWFFQGNAQLGRQRYEQSLQQDVPDSDSSRHQRADTLLMWAKTEFDFGFKSEGRRLCEQATASAERIANRETRHYMLRYIQSYWTSTGEELPDSLVEVYDALPKAVEHDEIRLGSAG